MTGEAAHILPSVDWSASVRATPPIDTSNTGTHSVRWGRWAVAAGALWLLLSMVYLTGPVCSDDVLYLEIARDPTLPADAGALNHGYGRVGFWLPMRLARAVFGEQWLTFLPVPLLSGLGTLWLTHRLARRWMGSSAAAVAVLAMGTLPLFVIYSTISLPDVSAAFVTMLALALVAPPLLDRETKGVVWRCILGGFVAGFGFSVKESVILMCPGLALFVLLTWTRCGWAWWRLTLIAIGSAAGLASEMAVLWWTTGDPMYHFHSIRESQRNAGSPVSDNQWRTLLIHATEYIRVMATGRGLFGLWGPVFLLSLCYALSRGTRWTRLLLCCLLVVGGYLSVGTSDLKNYFPLYHQPRYLIPLTPLAVLLTVYMIGDLRSRGRRMRTVVNLALIAVIAHALVVPNRVAGKGYLAGTHGAAYRLFNKMPEIANHDTSPIASPQSAQRLWLAAAETSTPRPEPIQGEIPVTAEEWIERYGGRWLIMTVLDRDADREARGGVLTFKSRSALGEFGAPNGVFPPHNRLNLIGSTMRWTNRRFDDRQRVEAILIPHRHSP